MKLTKPIIPTEHEEQVALFQWAEIMKKRYPELGLMFAIPNANPLNKFGGHAVAIYMRSEGLRAGVPDIFLPVPRNGYHGLFIEMKRQRGGRLLPPQEGWLGELAAQGYKVSVCNGWEKAMELIEMYLVED